MKSVQEKQSTPIFSTGSFFDRAGNQRHLSSGMEAAKIIQNGGIPELHFNECKEMHRHLDDMGLFKLDLNRIRTAAQDIKNVVYYGDIKDDNRFRVLNSWCRNQLTSYREEMPGWGDDLHSEVLNPAPNPFASKLQPISVCVNVDMHWDRPKGSIQELDAKEIQLLAQAWQAKHRLTNHVVAINAAQIMADNVYFGRGHLQISMDLQTFEQTHATFIARSACIPFYEWLIEDAGGRLYSQLRPQVYMINENDETIYARPRISN